MTVRETNLGIDYERPPVIEVVCGVQFHELSKLTAGLIGAYWTQIRDEYPETSSVPPLPHLVERPLRPALRKSQRMRLNAAALPRTFFIHESRNWVVQLQADRFLHNWRNDAGDASYPRFPAVFQRFQDQWNRFRAFGEAESLKIEVDQLELTYINHLPRGDGWNTLAEIGNAFPDLGWRRERSFLPSPEAMSWEAQFALPEEQGRLHVSISPGVHQDTQKEVILCELVARGIPPSLDEFALTNWFFLAREWIVRGFDDLTSVQVQDSIWRRKR